MNSKVVLVTGSSSGIGFGIAKAYAKAGATVILHGIEASDESAQRIKKEMTANVFYWSSDLSQKEKSFEGLDRLIEKTGPVSILVNNAGIQHVSPVSQFSSEQWQRVIDINLSSAFYLSKKVWPDMEKNQWGRIINIASVHGLRASEFKSAYVAAKHGLCGLSKVLALEGAPIGITANTICPGYVKTPLVDQQIKSQAMAHQMAESDVVEKVLLKKQAIKKFISIEAIAELCLYLSQPYCDAVTGTEFVLDGGWSAQ